LKGGTTLDQAAHIKNPIQLFIQDGLRIFKYKNSKLRLIVDQPEGNKGAVFGYRSKKNMIAGRGVVLTSEEALLENEQEFTHWTPNVYCYGTYIDENKTITKGHSEKNLKQITTFVVDIDSRKTHEGEIILACMDLIGFMPTLILTTEKGYQVFFVLSAPAFVTKKSNYKVIDIAKKISNNIRVRLNERIVGVDFGCNHFGITRFPSAKTIVYLDPAARYSFSDWIHWSMKATSDQATQEEKQKKVIQFPTEKKEIRQVDEPWFDLLLRKSNIVGGKGLMGRNNVIFTLALAYYSSGYSYETAEYNLLEFNDRLQEGLSLQEVQKIVKSAFSGEYQAASREKIEQLCKEWVRPGLTTKDLFILRRGWYKFKKPRRVRKYSHKNEWKEDLLAYLSEKSYIYKPYLIMTKKELSESTKIPLRSLTRVLDELKTEGKIFTIITRGRKGGLRLASIKTLLTSIICLKKEEKEAYIVELTRAFGLRSTTTESVGKPWKYSDTRTIIRDGYGIKIKDANCHLPYIYDTFFILLLWVVFLCICYQFLGVYFCFSFHDFGLFVYCFIGLIIGYVFEYFCIFFYSF
jgi:hypothetical protein